MWLTCFMSSINAKSLMISFQLCEILSKPSLYFCISYFQVRNCYYHRVTNEFKAADQAQQGVTLNTFRAFVEVHEGIFHPVYQLQHTLRVKTLGTAIWEKMTRQHARKRSFSEVSSLGLLYTSITNKFRVRILCCLHIYRTPR